MVCLKPLAIVRAVGIIVAFSLTFAGSSYELAAQHSLSRERAEFKKAMGDGMVAPSYRQSFRFGPLRDGRIINGQFQYLDNGIGLGVRRSRDGICVNFDRRHAAVAGYAVDASINCQLYGGCDKLPEYTLTLMQSRADVASLPLIEEYNPTLAPALRDWVRTPEYAKAWLSAFSSYMISMQLHELGHVVLNHSAAPDPRTGASQEAEADGFSAFVAQLAGFSNAAGAASVLDEVVSNGGSRLISRCRIEALVLPLRDWFKRYPFTSVRWNSLPSRPAVDQFGSSFDFSESLLGWDRESNTCVAYRDAFSKGVEKAIALVDVNTELKSDVYARSDCTDKDR